jgi:hypothetical protein
VSTLRSADPDLFSTEMDWICLFSQGQAGKAQEMKLTDRCILKFVVVNRDFGELYETISVILMLAPSSAVFRTSSGTEPLVWQMYLQGGKKRKLVRRALKFKCREIFSDLLQANDY